ncbi:unnamed protein product [Ostreobium quekettii]|uniref:Protein kinase domain-containing protein n=1 Tax=Ostreobium quekettii TaxID=121088 RepID=A0A8S1ISB4_9CHLO|nr:unnamed protein product [Ostreobium quekettii]
MLQCRRLPNAGGRGSFSGPLGKGSRKALREALLSWLQKLAGKRGRKVASSSSSGELTIHNIQQLTVSPVREPSLGNQRRTSTRSNSGSICSLRGSIHSKTSSVSKPSTDYYAACRNSRRSAIDLTASHSCRNEASLKEMQSTTSFLAVYSFFTTAHRGSHANIIKARHRHTHERVAVKVYNKEQIPGILWENITREIRILTMAEGAEGIVQLRNSYEDENQAIAVLEDCTGGTLISRMASKGGQLSEQMCAQTVVKPLLETLAWLHSQGIVLRDLKPEHVMFDGNGSLRLVDFFSAAIVGEDSLISREGTLAYMAPEMVHKPTPEEVFNEVIGHGLSEADFPAYTQKVDIWSLGVIIFEALTGRQPFLAETAEDLRDVQDKTLASHGGLRTSLDSIKMREHMSPSALDFLTSIMRIDPDERPSAKELLDHAWLVSACRASLLSARTHESTDSFVSAVSPPKATHTR